MTGLRSGAPVGDGPVPAPVVAFAAGAPITPVWRNEVGGLTFRIGRPGGACFMKWDPAGSGESLTDERDRLDWLAGRFPAPSVVAAGADESGSWLVTAAIDALSAVAPRWKREPETAVREIARGLRMLHETLDPGECPFSWSVEERLAAKREVDDRLRAAPSVDRLVVCHGDPCSPNTLIAETGEFAAIVDVGRLGVADRWADLAVASMSLEWNYGPGWEELFFTAYGIAPDPGRIAYYRALWNAR